MHPSSVPSGLHAARIARIPTPLFVFLRSAQTLLAASLLGCGGGTQDEDFAYVLSHESFELGVTTRLDANYAYDSLALLNLRNDALRVTLLGVTGEGAEMVEPARTADFTTLASENAIEMTISMVSARSLWRTGTWAPMLGVQLGRVVDASADWEDPNEWTYVDIEIPIHFEVNCDIDADGGDATTCGGDDCDDEDSTVAVGMEEVCDGVDNDCDGTADNEATDGIILYTDYDNDGYGDVTLPAYSCQSLAGYSEDGTDCDDTDAASYPGATETCDEADNNCDGAVDEGLAFPFYADVDADGYGDASASIDACAVPSGYVEDDTDCDDTDAASYPGGTETCDSVDNNCDGAVDEGLLSTFFADGDADSFGDASTYTYACAAPSGYVEEGTDCDDTDVTVFPGAVEAQDDQDDDCDEWVDEDFVSAGGLVLTELQVDGALGVQGLQWFEVYNASGAQLSLDGWQVVVTTGGAPSGFFVSPDAGLALAAADHAVFCQDADALVASAPSVTCDYEYATADNGYADSVWGADQVESLALDSSSGSLRLYLDSATIDDVTWDAGAGWPVATGASLNLEPTLLDATSNDLSASWCAATAAYSTDGLAFGSPGGVNESCSP